MFLLYCDFKQPDHPSQGLTEARQLALSCVWWQLSARIISAARQLHSCCCFTSLPLSFTSGREGFLSGWPVRSGLCLPCGDEVEKSWTLVSPSTAAPAEDNKLYKHIQPLWFWHNLPALCPYLCWKMIYCIIGPMKRYTNIIDQKNPRINTNEVPRIDSFISFLRTARLHTRPLLRPFMPL